MTKREFAIIALLSLVALTVNRLLWDPQFGGADAISYVNFAREAQSWGYWLKPEAFGSNYFPMGYPSLFAVMIRVTGSEFSMQILILLLGSALPLIAWALAYHLGTRVRITVMIVVVASPSVWFLARHNGYETVVAVIMSTALLIQLWLRRDSGVPFRRALILAYLSGFGLGLGILSSAPVIAVVPTILYLAWKRARESALACALGVCTLPGLWMLRNIFVTNRWSPLSTNGELVFWHGNNWTTTNGGVQAELIPPPPGYDSLKDAAFGFISSQPEAAFSLLLRRFMRLLEPTYLYSGADGMLHTLPHWYAIVFSAVGVLLFSLFVFGRFWVGTPPLPDVTPHAVLVLSFLVFLLPFQAEPRYLAPLVPVSLVVAVSTGFVGFDRLRHVWRSREIKQVR